MKRTRADNNGEGGVKEARRRPRRGSFLSPEESQEDSRDASELPDPLEIIRNLEHEDSICESQYCKWVDAIVSFLSLTLLVVTTSVLLSVITLPQKAVNAVVLFYAFGMPLYMILAWRRFYLLLMTPNFSLSPRERSINWTVLGFLMVTGFWAILSLSGDPMTSVCGLFLERLNNLREDLANQFTVNIAQTDAPVLL